MSKMIDFISSQLVDGEGALTLAYGSGDDADVVAEVMVCGDHLVIESNCPDWVTTREIYEHLRWRSMPNWEKQSQLRTESLAYRAMGLKNDKQADLAAAAPFRFEKVGEMWVVHFTTLGQTEFGYFHDHRGFRYYAKLLGNPDVRIESLVLAGRADLITSGVSAAESSLPQMLQHDPEAVAQYKDTLNNLSKQLEVASERADEKEASRLSDEIDAIKSFLWKGGKSKRTLTGLGRKKLGGRTIPQTIHSTVGQAMRRAISTLMKGGMKKCAAYLEQTIMSDDGESMKYCPLDPRPLWRL